MNITECAFCDEFVCVCPVEDHGYDYYDEIAALHGTEY